MHGLHRYSYRLRCKSSPALQQARPKNSTHGNCLICGRFMEVLREGRCHSDDCNALLRKLCLERGLGMQHIENADIWTIFNPSAIVTEAEHWNATGDTHALDHNTCACDRGLKMPRADICTQCYREGNVAKMHNRRKRQQAKRTKITSKIKGLEKIKLK